MNDIFFFLDAGKNLSIDITGGNVNREENKNKQIKNFNEPLNGPLYIRKPCILDDDLTKRAANLSNYKIPVKKSQENFSTERSNCYENKVFLGK